LSNTETSVFKHLDTDLDNILDALSSKDPARIDEMVNRIVKITGKGPEKEVLPGDFLVRHCYNYEVKGLWKMEQQMIDRGLDTEAIARAMNQARRELGIKYKDLTSPEARVKIYGRNQDIYEDELGPTVDWLRNKGRSWGEIIESAKRPDSDTTRAIAGIE
jgi:hypothetical protein